MCHHSIDKFTLPITTMILVCAVCYYYATQYEIFNRYDKYTKKTERKKHQKVGIKCQTSKLTKVEVSKSFDIFSEVSLFSGSSSGYTIHCVYWDQKCAKSDTHFTCIAGLLHVSHSKI